MNDTIFRLPIQSCDQLYYRDVNNRAAGLLGTCNRCPCENADSCSLDSNRRVVCNCRQGYYGDRCTELGKWAHWLWNAPRTHFRWTIWRNVANSHVSFLIIFLIWVFLLIFFPATKNKQTINKNHPTDYVLNKGYVIRISDPKYRNQTHYKLYVRGHEVGDLLQPGGTKHIDFS